MAIWLKLVHTKKNNDNFQFGTHQINFKVIAKVIEKHNCFKTNWICHNEIFRSFDFDPWIRDNMNCIVC